MFRIISRLLTAWPMVAKRGLAHWRLLSSVIIGVLLASAIMAGTVIYFDALRELALKNTLSKLTTNQTNILVKADRGPTTQQEYTKVGNAMIGEINARVSWMLRDSVRGGKSATFFLAAPGREAAAGQDNARTYFAFTPRLDQHITILPGGRPPQEQALSSGPRQPLHLEAIAPVEAARLFGVGVGDSLSAVPWWDDVIPYATVTISGLFERKDPDNEFWHLDDTIYQASTSGSFRAIPFYVSEKTFFEVLGAAFRDLDSTYGWLLAVDRGSLNAGNATSALADIQTMERRLSTDLFGYRQLTSLDRALEEYDQRLFFSKLPMFIILILIAVVILYYVVTLSSLLVEQQRAEVALLRSRGATSAQVLVVFVLEGATISLLAIIVAPLLAAFVIGLLGFTPAFSGLSGAGWLSVGISRGAYMMSALGGLLSFAALMVPAVQASRIGVTRHRQQAARPTGQPFFQRYYLDVLLLVVSVILFRQLTEQGSVVATSLFGRVTVNQVLLAVPAVILVALAMVLLRLFPLSIRFLSGDSPAIVDIVVAGTALILAPLILLDGAFNGGGLTWLAQLAMLLALAGVYAAMRFTKWMPFSVAIPIQAGLVAGILLVGSELPFKQAFVPILIGIVPAQVLFALLRAFAQRSPVGISLGLWQMARNPTHYARLSLLMILMAGLGIFAASFGGTLQRNFEERAFYSTGSDIRLEGVLLNTRGSTRPLVASYQELDDVEQVGQVFRGFGTDLSRLIGESYIMLAVDKDTVADIGWFRDDFADEAMPDLLRSLGHPSPPEGIPLPADARSIAVRLRPDRAHPTIMVTARLRDANERYFTYFLGTLDNADWMELQANLTRTETFGRGAPLQPTHPMTLVSLAVHEVNGRGRLRAGSLSFAEVLVRTSNGAQVIEHFDESSRWSVMRVAPESITDGVRKANTALDGDASALTFVWSEGGPLISRGIFHGPPVTALPVLASKSFIRDTGHQVGQTLEVSVAGHRLPVKIVNAIDFFPTADTFNDRFLISDISSLSRYVNLESTSAELRPNEVWLSTSANGSDRTGLVRVLRGEQPFTVRTVHDRQQALADSQVDPLVEAGWRALLFIAFAAVLVLSGLGFLVHAYVSFRDREGQFALMRTIGFSMRQLMVLVWLEQALVIGAGMALGAWMGGRLGAIIMPFLAHDDRGSEVLPPFVIQINWSTLTITYAAMLAVFAIIIIGMVWFIRKISLQRILRLGE
jgi:ABC-type lipoprotein release transport system permease subunit